MLSPLEGAGGLGEGLCLSGTFYVRHTGSCSPLPSGKPFPESSPSKPFYYYWQERIQSWDFRELWDTQKAERPVDAPSPALMESKFWSMSLPFSLLPPHPSDIPPGAIPALDREVQASWGRGGAVPGSFLPSAVIQGPKPREAVERRAAISMATTRLVIGEWGRGRTFPPKLTGWSLRSRKQPLRCRDWWKGLASCREMQKAGMCPGVSSSGDSIHLEHLTCPSPSWWDPWAGLPRLKRQATDRGGPQSRRPELWRQPCCRPAVGARENHFPSATGPGAPPTPRLGLPAVSEEAKASPVA